MRRTVIGVVIGLGIAAVVPLAIVASGAIDMRAGADEDFLDWVGGHLLERSVARRAPDVTAPIIDRDAAEARGYEQYVAMCVHCHGAPGVAPAEFAEGMSPRPPALDERAPMWSDAELFHIIESGVRMTAMPSFGVNHDDRDIWDLVAFLRVLDRITDQQRHELAEATLTHDRDHGTMEHAEAGDHSDDARDDAAKPEDTAGTHSTGHEPDGTTRSVATGGRGGDHPGHAHARARRSRRARVRDRASGATTDDAIVGAQPAPIEPDAPRDHEAPPGPEPCTTLVRTLRLGACDENGVWRRVPQT